MSLRAWDLAAGDARAGSPSFELRLFPPEVGTENHRHHIPYRTLCPSISAYICTRIIARTSVARQNESEEFQSTAPHAESRRKKPLFCPPPRPVPIRCDAHQGNFKGKGSERKGQKKIHKGKAPPSPYTVPADAMKSGVGRKSAGPSPFGSSTPAPCTSIHSRTSSCVLVPGDCGFAVVAWPDTKRNSRDSFSSAGAVTNSRLRFRR